MSVNKVILLGNVTRDPEVRNLVSGSVVCNICIATSKKGYRTQGGIDVPEQTEFHNCVIWGEQGEICERYVRKGMKLYAEGELRTTSWEKDGQKHYRTEIHLSTFEICTPKSQSDTPVNKSGTFEEFQKQQNEAILSASDDLPF